MDTLIETKPKLDDGSTTKKFVRHIVKRIDAKGGQLGNITLCGELWDIANPTTGDYCKKCVEIYRNLHPGWPLPG